MIMTMSNTLNESDKILLTTVLNECTVQIRTKCLYASGGESTDMVKNIKHLKEIGEKIGLKIL